MRNYWLDEYTEPVINQYKSADWLWWYASKKLKNDKGTYRQDGTWYESSIIYLHQDGTWYESTLKDGKWTGCFDSKEEIEALLKNA